MVWFIILISVVVTVTSRRSGAVNQREGNFRPKKKSLGNYKEKKNKNRNMMAGPSLTRGMCVHVERT